jgi:hypothetical protein
LSFAPLALSAPWRCALLPGNEQENFFVHEQRSVAKSKGNKYYGSLASGNHIKVGILVFLCPVVTTLPHRFAFPGSAWEQGRQFFCPLVLDLYVLLWCLSIKFAYQDAHA